MIPGRVKLGRRSGVKRHADLHRSDEPSSRRINIASPTIGCAGVHREAYAVARSSLEPRAFLIRHRGPNRLRLCP
jgi:hypothetical protein